jgi:hypothetical protein
MRATVIAARDDRCARGDACSGQGSDPACGGDEVVHGPTRNVFVLGLDDFQRTQLETVTDAANLRFHGLLDVDVVTSPGHGLEELLDLARGQLEAFDGSVDAIITHWDFPSSVMAPILGAERGLPVPPLRAVVACEHKLWSRLEQRASVPEVVPDVAGFDPFDDDAFERIAFDPPYWVKPIKTHSSQLGFAVDDGEALRAALPTIRDGIRAFGDPFNEVLARVDLPDTIGADSGNSCIAEGLIAGDQATVEGTMFRGEFAVHGVIDSPKDEQGLHFSRYEYPATSIPRGVQDRMIDTCERFLRQVGFDDGCWNIEFMYDEGDDQLWLVEANTRISQSHSDLFAKVDGVSNHEVALDVAFGCPPRMPRGRGSFEVAAKCFLWTEEMEDGIVRRVPDERQLDEVARRFPGTHVHIAVEPEDRLSELADQSSYRYDIGTLFIGAQSRRELLDRYETCRELLTFDIEPVDDD